MASTLVQVTITLGTAKTTLPAGVTSGGVSAVVTDSTGAAQPAVTMPAGGPYAFNTSLPVSSDGVTVSCSVVATALDSTGTPISAPGNPSASIPLTLTEPSFDLPTSATMVLTPAAAAANPAIVAAIKGKK